MRAFKDEWITASDGIRICVDVYLPDGDGPFPALYAVAPFRKDLLYLPAVSIFRYIEPGPIDHWTGHGYAVVIGDQRGTGRSEGEFELFGPAEQRDFHDTIEWIASRPWSTGKVSMTGKSARPEIRLLGPGRSPPHPTRHPRVNTSGTPNSLAGKLVRGLLLVSAGVLTAVTGVIVWALCTVGGGPAFVAATVVLAAPWAIVHWLTTLRRSHRSKAEVVQRSASASP
ncbi:CocE/NonD family hydrolase [Streptomyces sp. NPDC005279]|uniref:CocE/NonD family hydrolase n=1 Tax=Streptomyces sp. NPDC005279 TaxID=3364712 RepID=UPI003680FF20